MRTLISIGLSVALGFIAGYFFVGFTSQPQLPTVEAFFTYPGTTKPYDDNPERTVFVPYLSQLGDGDSLDVAVYIFTDNQIGDSVLQAFQNGAKVRIFTDSERACSRGSEISRLASAGIPVHVDNHSGEMHHKFAVFFKKYELPFVITGSYNWSEAANEDNWENVVVIRDLEVVLDYAENFDLMWEKSTSFIGCP